MPRWSQNDLIAYEQRRKDRANSKASNPKFEPPVCHESLAAKEGAGHNAGRVKVRFTSYRIRLLDPDDLCPKYFIDGLRYAGLLPGDSEAEISYERPTQVKVYSKDDERTVIEIEQMEGVKV